MSQNLSSAVMQQRTEPRNSLDDFPTPPWATRALCEALARRSRESLSIMSAREPAANRGYMARTLLEYFKTVEASDVHDYGAGFPIRDFLFDVDRLGKVDWTITNPPFRLSEQFITVALDTSEQGVAIFARTAFLEGVGRYERIFSHCRPTLVLPFSERVVLHKGKLAPKGSTATAYCWIVWEKHWRGTSLKWIEPCRKRLEKQEDYQ
jgi:hypothetical protein